MEVESREDVKCISTYHLTNSILRKEFVATINISPLDFFNDIKNRAYLTLNSLYPIDTDRPFFKGSKTQIFGYPTSLNLAQSELHSRIYKSGLFHMGIFL